MAQEKFILSINENTTLSARLFEEDDFSKIKTKLQLVESKPYKNSITRIYHDNNQKSVYELFNGTAIQFDKIIRKEDLEQVEFSRVLFSDKKDEVTYIIDIEDSFYQVLQTNIIAKIEIDELDFFGEFYKLENGNVLTKWSAGFRPAKFSILKDIRTMASISPELLSDLDTSNQKNPIDWVEIIENTEYEPVRFEVGEDKAISDVRKRISNLLNLEVSLLDFSIESVDLLESSIIWNYDKISKYELFDLCYPYLGEVARRRNNLRWVKENNYLTLVDNNFRKLDFGFNLQRGITQSDYIPTIKWVIEQLEVDLKRE